MTKVAKESEDQQGFTNSHISFLQNHNFILYSVYNILQGLFRWGMAGEISLLL